jgi:catechol 2,3-dioxygenase-like lactoylglutathione lyase family enzyme
MNAHILGIDHVMVTVGDLDSAREFYEGVLGLEEIECPVKDGLRVWYKIGNQQLHVNLQEKYHKAGFCHFAIAIKSDKYHEYANSVLTTGYKISCESQKFADGIYRFYVDDPFSNTVEIYQAHCNT